LPPLFLSLFEKTELVLRQCTALSLCGSPFQTIECEEDAAAIPSALADTTWGGRTEASQARFFPEQWIGVRAPQTGTRLKAPALLYRKRGAFVLSLRKRRGRICSLFGIVVLGLRSGFPGVKGWKGCIRMHVDSAMPTCGFGGRKSKGEGIMACMNSSGVRLFWGEQVITL
jgi:hypothetical protein